MSVLSKWVIDSSFSFHCSFICSPSVISDHGRHEFCCLEFRDKSLGPDNRFTTRRCVNVVLLLRSLLILFTESFIIRAICAASWAIPHSHIHSVCKNDVPLRTPRYLVSLSRIDLHLVKRNPMWDQYGDSPVSYLEICRLGGVERWGYDGSDEVPRVSIGRYMTGTL